MVDIGRGLKRSHKKDLPVSDLEFRFLTHGGCTLSGLQQVDRWRATRHVLPGASSLAAVVGAHASTLGARTESALAPLPTGQMRRFRVDRIEGRGYLGSGLHGPARQRQSAFALHHRNRAHRRAAVLLRWGSHVQAATQRMNKGLSFGVGCMATDV